MAEITGHVLIGKTITGVQMTSDKKAIRFEVEGGEQVLARADGDCCSSTWIEHVNLPAGGFPAKVTSATDIDMPEPDGKDEDDFGDVTQYYGFKIQTDKGDMVLDYRNESNGYYGGNLSWDDEYFYGGVFGQNLDNGDWKSIAEDV